MLPARRPQDNNGLNINSEQQHEQEHQQQQQQSSSKNNDSRTDDDANVDIYNLNENKNREQQYVHKSKSDVEVIPPNAAGVPAAAAESDNISIASTADTYRTAQQCSNASSSDDFFSCATSATSSTCSSTTELAANKAGAALNVYDNPNDLLHVSTDDDINNSPTTFARKSSNNNNNQLRASLDTLHDVENMMDEQQQQQQQQQEHEAAALRRELAARSTTPVAKGRFRGWTIPVAEQRETPAQKDDDVDMTRHDKRNESHASANSATKSPVAFEDEDSEHLTQSPSSPPPSPALNNPNTHLPIVRLPSTASSAASDENNTNDYNEPLQIVDDDDDLLDDSPLFIRESATSPHPPTLRPILKKSRYEDYAPATDAPSENYEDFNVDKSLLSSSSASNETTTQSAPEAERQSQKQAAPHAPIADFDSEPDESPTTSPEPTQRRNVSPAAATSISTEGSSSVSLAADNNGNGSGREQTATETSSSSHRLSPDNASSISTAAGESEISDDQKKPSSPYEQHEFSSSASPESQLQAQTTAKLPLDSSQPDVDEIIITQRREPSPEKQQAETTIYDAANISVATDIVADKTASEEMYHSHNADTLPDAAFQTTKPVSDKTNASSADHIDSVPPTGKSDTVGVSDETTYVLQLRKRSIPLASTASSEGELEGETTITKLEIAEDDAVEKDVADDGEESEEEETEALTITEIRQRHAEEFAAVESATAAATAAAAAAANLPPAPPKVDITQLLATRIPTPEDDDDDNLILASISPPPTPNENKITPLNLDDETGSHTTTDPEGLSVIDEESEPVNTEDERERNLLQRQQSSVIDDDENREPLSPVTKTAGIVELPASDTNSDAEVLHKPQHHHRGAKSTPPVLQPLRRDIVSSTPQRRKMLNLDQFVAATEHSMSDYVSNSDYVDDFADDARKQQGEEDDAGPREFGEESLIIVSPLDLERASLKSGSLYNSSSGSGRGGGGGGVGLSDDNTSTLKKSKRSSVGDESSSSSSSRRDDDSGSGTISTSSVEEEDIPVIHIPNQIYNNNNLISLTDALSYGEDEDEQEQVSNYRLKPLHKLREPTAVDRVEEAPPMDIKRLIQRFERSSSSSGDNDENATTAVSEKIVKDSAAPKRADFQQAAAKQSVARLTAPPTKLKYPEKMTDVEAVPIRLLKKTDATTTNDDEVDDDEPAWKKAYKKRFLMTETSAEPDRPVVTAKPTTATPEVPSDKRLSTSPTSESRSGAQTPTTDNDTTSTHTPPTATVDSGQAKQLENVDSTRVESMNTNGQLQFHRKDDEQAMDDDTSEAERTILQKLVDKYETSGQSTQKPREAAVPVTAAGTSGKNAPPPSVDGDVVPPPTVTTIVGDTDHEEEQQQQSAVALPVPKPHQTVQPPPIPERPAHLLRTVPQPPPAKPTQQATFIESEPVPKMMSSKAELHMARQAFEYPQQSSAANTAVAPPLAKFPPTERPSVVAHKQWQTTFTKPAIPPPVPEKPFVSTATEVMVANEPVTSSKLTVNLKEPAKNSAHQQPPLPIDQKLPASNEIHRRVNVNTTPATVVAPERQVIQKLTTTSNTPDTDQRPLAYDAHSSSRSTSSVIITPPAYKTERPRMLVDSPATVYINPRAWPPTYNMTKPFDMPPSNGFGFPSSPLTDTPLSVSNNNTASSSMYKKTEYTNNFVSSNSSSLSSSSDTRRTVDTTKPNKSTFSWPPRLPDAQNNTTTSSVTSSVWSPSKPVQERTIPVTVVGADGQNRRIYSRAKTSPLTTSISLATSTTSDEEQSRQKSTTETTRPRIPAREQQRQQRQPSYSREHSIPISVENGGGADSSSRKTSTVVIATRATPNTTTYQHRELPVFNTRQQQPFGSDDTPSSSLLQSEIASLEAEAEKLQQQISPFTYFQQLAQNQNQQNTTTSQSRRVWNEYGSATASHHNGYNNKPAQSYTTTSTERVVPISLQPRRSSLAAAADDHHAQQNGHDDFTIDDSFDMHLAQQAPVTLSFAKRKMTSSTTTTAAQQSSLRQRDSSLPGSSTNNNVPNTTRDARSKLSSHDSAGGGGDVHKYVVMSDYIKGQLLQHTTTTSQTSQQAISNSSFVQNFQQGRRANPNERLIVTDFGKVSQAEIDALYEASKGRRLPLQTNGWSRRRSTGAEEDDEQRHHRRQNGGEVASEYREVINMLDECMKNMSQLLN